MLLLLLLPLHCTRRRRSSPAPAGGPPWLTLTGCRLGGTLIVYCVGPASRSSACVAGSASWGAATAAWAAAAPSGPPGASAAPACWSGAAPPAPWRWASGGRGGGAGMSVVVPSGCCSSCRPAPAAAALARPAAWNAVVAAEGPAAGSGAQRAPWQPEVQVLRPHEACPQWPAHNATCYCCQPPARGLTPARTAHLRPTSAPPQPTTSSSSSSMLWQAPGQAPGPAHPCPCAPRAWAAAPSCP